MNSKLFQTADDVFDHFIPSWRKHSPTCAVSDATVQRTRPDLGGKEWRRMLRSRARAAVADDVEQQLADDFDGCLFPSVICDCPECTTDLDAFERRMELAGR